jgi:lipoyl(octanoyl) transferase
LKNRQNKTVILQHLGLIPYQTAWEIQESVFKKVVDTKVLNRDLPQDEQHLTQNFIFTCEHPPVYTLGKSGKKEHLLLSESGLNESKVQYFEINRGGDITFHGPGQLVVYPILDLDNFFTDIHKYLRLLEESVIATLAHFNIQAGRIDGLTGVWVGAGSPNPRKICAMGVRASRWVTMHGLALNVNTELNYFNHIIPCGIDDKAVTSMASEINSIVNFDTVTSVLIDKMSTIFEMNIEKV